MNTPTELLKQHLIDPEICIRCNTCEATCPLDAITHNDRNYVVNVDKCNYCMACVPPCPTGSIDNWRVVPKANTYSVEQQLTWDALPDALSTTELEALNAMSSGNANPQIVKRPNNPSQAFSVENDLQVKTTSISATVPPWSAAHPFTNLYSVQAPTIATVVGNVQINASGTRNETHHIVLDFGAMPFPVLEGQSVGIIAVGADAYGKPHHPRQYSVASPRNGERPHYNNLALTVKRVVEDYQGKPVRGIASNYLCDLKLGDQVQVIGPFGNSFLMPNHPKSHIVMICTGTGSAPMRAMTEWRRRLRQSGKFESGKLVLFFGARTAEELPYFGPLQKLPKDFIDINLAFSREAGKPKRYVQDVMRSRSPDLLSLLTDNNSYFYVCGLKSMEAGVILALRDIADEAGLDWESLAQTLKQQGRLHLETY